MAGNIAKRSNGKWRARYRDDQGREHSRHFDRKVDAQRWIDEVTTSVISGTYVDPKAGGVTFSEFYDDWSARQLWVHKTRENADLAARSVPFGDMPLGRIRRSHVEAWIKTMAVDLAPTTIKTRYVIIRSAFRAAVLDRLIVTDPSAGVTLPRRRRADAAMSVPTAEQVGRLLQHAESTRVSTRKGFRAYVALCAFAGLRLGEAAGVQVGDIDFTKRQLHVARQIQREASAYIVRTPKYGSERVVYLPDELVEILAEHVRLHLSPNPTPEQWLFTVKGQPMYDNAVAWRWRATRTAADLEHIRLHDLRHFYASGLIAEGCDVVTVQRSLGHATASTTLNTYSHLWPTAEDRTRAAASRIARSALEVADSELATAREPASV